METAKRKLKRVRLVCSLDICEGQGGQLLGRVEDLTAEGMRIRGPIFLETSSIGPVRLRLPSEIEGRTELDFDVECMWSCESDVPDLFDSGLRLYEPLPDVVEVIETLIRRFQR